MTHSALVCVTQSSAKSYDEDALTRKSVHVRQWFFRTQESTNENDVTHLYFQDRTYEHSIQKIIVPIFVRMIPRTWSLWRANYWQRWITQVFENVEIFSEQVKGYQMFRHWYKMSLVWWLNSKTDLRGSSRSWRWFSIDLRYIRELKVCKRTGKSDVVTNVRGKAEDDEEKMSSKTKSLSAGTKRSNPKLNWEKALFDCLVVCSLDKLITRFLCYDF